LGAARDIPLLIALAVLIGLAVALAAAETGLLSVRRAAVEVSAESGNRQARRLLGLLDDLPRVISAVLLTVLVVQVTAAMITAVLAQRWFGSLGVTAATILLTLVLFVYGEVIPKTWTIRAPLPVALRLSTPVSAIAVVLRPVVSVLVAFAEMQSPGRGVGGTTAVSEGELRKLAAESAVAGEIGASDAEMIERSFELGDLTVEDVLVPRPDIAAVDTTTTASKALDVALQSGHRRLPVHEGSLDTISGVVRLQDLAAAISSGVDPPVTDLMREALEVPETMLVMDLIRRMKDSGDPFALAVDEHGGIAGIVTIDDVVAELLGHIDADRNDRGSIHAIADHRWLVTGTTHIDELEAVLGLSFPECGLHTVGGLVIDQAGHIPSVSETVVVSGATFEVTQRTLQRVLELEVRHTPTA
jgi:putative hemolysin